MLALAKLDFNYSHQKSKYLGIDGKIFLLAQYQTYITKHPS
jgi:hypothetical protein